MKALHHRYESIKAQLPDRTLLFFKIGPYYEAWFDDANECSKILGIPLESRDDIAMFSIPVAESTRPTELLLKAGWKVAISDQDQETRNFFLRNGRNTTDL